MALNLTFFVTLLSYSQSSKKYVTITKKCGVLHKSLSKGNLIVFLKYQVQNAWSVFILLIIVMVFLDDFSFMCSGVTSSWKLAFIELLSLCSRVICDLLLPLEVYFCLDEYVWLQTHLCHNKLTSDFVFLGSCSLVATAGHSSESKNVAMWDTLLPQKKALIACNYFFKLIYSR